MYVVFLHFLSFLMEAKHMLFKYITISWEVDYVCSQIFIWIVKLSKFTVFPLSKISIARC